MKLKIISLIFFYSFLAAVPTYAESRIPMSIEMVHQSVKDTLKTVTEVYVYPEKSKKIEKEMIKRLQRGDYDHISSNIEFEEVISKELIELSTDGHMGIMLARTDGKERTQVLTETEDRLKNNYAFEKIEILKGNVGYLKFNKFYVDEPARNKVDQAFGFLDQTDAMIIDLRDNIGGSPDLVNYMLSHFFAEETLFLEFHTRDQMSAWQIKSLKGLGPEKFKNDFPLYILISNDTASGAEMFSYTLKHFKKARLVGQSTLGIAHAVGAVKINDLFDGRFSLSRPESPATKTSWEVVGVQPDIKTSLENSLYVAHQMALDELSSSNSIKGAVHAAPFILFN